MQWNTNKYICILSHSGRELTVLIRLIVLEKDILPSNTNLLLNILLLSWQYFIIMLTIFYYYAENILLLCWQYLVIMLAKSCYYADNILLLC